MNKSVLFFFEFSRLRQAIKQFWKECDRSGFRAKARPSQSPMLYPISDHEEIIAKGNCSIVFLVIFLPEILPCHIWEIYFMILSYLTSLSGQRGTWWRHNLCRILYVIPNWHCAPWRYRGAMPIQWLMTVFAGQRALSHDPSLCRDSYRLQERENVMVERYT